MKRFYYYRKTLQALISASVFMGILAASSGAVVSADTSCSGGQLPTSAGQCCPTELLQIDSSGNATCEAASSAGCSGSGSNISNDKASSCLFTTYINPTIQVLSAVVGILVVIGIIRGGLEYTSSGGDPAKAAAGKQHIVNALIGLAAFLMLYAFLQFIIPGGLLNG